MTAGIKAGYLMPLGAVRVGPVVGLDYARARVDGYTEEGDAALALNVGRERFSSLRGSLGAEVRGDFAGGGVQLRPYAAAVIEKEFRGDERTITFCADQRAGDRQQLSRRGRSKKAYGRLSVGPERGDPVGRVAQRQRVGHGRQGPGQRDHAATSGCAPAF